MKTVRDGCKLQPNSLSIKLSDQIEQLDELITTQGDGTEFFEKTFITQGMQDLITEGIARLGGASSQAVFHLKQAMGGGKTHLLVGFGLLARHADLRKTYCAGMPHASSFKGASIAAFNGRNTPDHFFWGEIQISLAEATSSKRSGRQAQKLLMKKTGSNFLREISRSSFCSMRCHRTLITSILRKSGTAQSPTSLHGRLRVCSPQRGRRRTSASWFPIWRRRTTLGPNSSTAPSKTHVPNWAAKSGTLHWWILPPMKSTTSSASGCSSRCRTRRDWRHR